VSDSTNRIIALARHEYRSAVRSKILIVLLGILVAVTAVSVYIASVDYASKLADYQAYVDAAKTSGLDRIAPSPLAALSLLRGAFEYLEIIGAVISIALGYLTVSRERSNRTLPLIRSRPVTSGEIATGSLLGALGVIATLVGVTAIVGVLGVGIIGHDWINATQTLKLFLAYVASIVYMGAFYCLGAIATAKSRVAANGLMTALGIWLIVVLVLPQIGDTMDADNQIPGGLFKALTLDRNGETQVLKHFTTYERIRTWTEEASLAKHYERFSFGMTDVKERYRPYSLPWLLGQTRNDIGWLIAYAGVLYASLRRAFKQQPTIPQGGTQ
jgi:ABC-type transport system involved in multi-copper enzyme maturation permease subunit